MEDRNFSALVDAVVEKTPDAPQGVKDRIRLAFEAVRDNGELLTLKPDEVALIEDYRLWRSGHEGAGPVFHWKRR